MTGLYFSERDLLRAQSVHIYEVGRRHHIVVSEVKSKSKCTNKDGLDPNVNKILNGLDQDVIGGWWGSLY